VQFTQVDGRLLPSPNANLVSNAFSKYIQTYSINIRIWYGIGNPTRNGIGYLSVR